MDKELSLVEHLNELRKRLIVCAVSLTIGTAIGFPFSRHLLKVLKAPAAGTIEKLVFFSPQEAFLIYLRLAFFAGIAVSLPVILYEVWLFVSPALEERFKKSGSYFILCCLVSFAAGALFAYFVLIPPSLKFLLSFAADDLEPVISAVKYISFVTSLILGCGIVFQMPVLSLIFTKFGLINSRILRRKYKYAVVVIFIIAAIITPTSDVFNMLMLALPMLFLYELSIWISFLTRSKILG